jgi:hypothetical protein
MRSRSILIVVLAGIITGIATCGLVWWFLAGWTSNSLSASDRAIEQTQLILEEFDTRGGEAALDNLPLDAQYGVKQCRSLLRTAMINSNNQYKLVVAGVWGDEGTPTGLGADEVMIEVIFADGTRAELQYYNNTLVVCREKTDDP